MPTSYVLGELVTKAAYFSLAAAAFIFSHDDVVARSSSLSFQRATAAAFSSRTNSLGSARF